MDETKFKIDIMWLNQKNCLLSHPRGVMWVSNFMNSS